MRTCNNCDKEITEEVSIYKSDEGKTYCWDCFESIYRDYDNKLKID